MRLAGRRILLTGASGYLGSNLAARLVAEDAAVCAVVHVRVLDSDGAAASGDFGSTGS